MSGIITTCHEEVRHINRINDTYIRIDDVCHSRYIFQPSTFNFLPPPSTLIHPTTQSCTIHILHDASTTTSTTKPQPFPNIQPSTIFTSPTTTPLPPPTHPKPQHRPPPHPPTLPTTLTTPANIRRNPPTTTATATPSTTLSLAPLPLLYLLPLPRDHRVLDTTAGGKIAGEFEY